MRCRILANEAAGDASCGLNRVQAPRLQVLDLNMRVIASDFREQLFWAQLVCDIRALRATNSLSEKVTTSRALGNEKAGSIRTSRSLLSLLISFDVFHFVHVIPSLSTIAWSQLRVVV